MTKDEPGPAPGGTDGMPEAHEDAGLARAYQDAAARDAWHERAGGGPAKGDPAQGDRDPTLALTPEVPDKPLPDVARPDKADGEDHDAPPSAKGPEYDALMRGLEPGETSVSMDDEGGSIPK